MWPGGSIFFASAWLGIPPHSRFPGRGAVPVGLRLARGPLPFDAVGNLLGSDFDTVSVAFRFPAIQGAKIRACDYSKYGLVNLCASDFTPIAPPNWDHIAQIASGLSNPPREWSFTKAGRKAAYKNFPMSPNQAQYCIVPSAIRAISNGTDSPHGRYYYLERPTQYTITTASRGLLQ